MPLSVTSYHKCRTIVAGSAIFLSEFVHFDLPVPNSFPLEPGYRSERGKNGLVLAIVESVASMIDCELDLIELEVNHPELFPDASEQNAPDFDLHLAAKSGGLGLIGIAEIVVGLWLSEEIVGRNGRPAPLKRIAAAFEYVLGISFGDIYDKMEDIYDRKPFNRTKALDFLRSLIIRREKENNK